MAEIMWTGDYTSKPQGQLLKAQIGANDPTLYGAWLSDIAQNRFFTVDIKDFVHFALPMSDDESQKSDMSGTYFLPVKSIDITLSRVDSMSVPVFFFGDFPIINKKRVGVIRLTCFDLDNDSIEREIRHWMEDECFIGTRVRYLSQMAKELTYKSYDVTGKLNYEKTVLTIPTSDVSISRNYEDGAKLVSFSLAVVGEEGSGVKTGKGGKAITVPKGDPVKAKVS